MGVSLGWGVGGGMLLENSGVVVVDGRRVYSASCMKRDMSREVVVSWRQLDDEERGCESERHVEGCGKEARERVRKRLER